MALRCEEFGKYLNEIRSVPGQFVHKISQVSIFKKGLFQNKEAVYNSVSLETICVRLDSKMHNNHSCVRVTSTCKLKYLAYVVAVQQECKKYNRGERCQTR